ncbi:Putative aldehyde dehydrogenase domain, aldehyde/histidinol dehydrogenase [Septoria linicola]|uniref:Aldehyde dehydrogenase domain, aldehyde/histidinol dehydrogenase n=1 Tax=Septoria linicola TaxID=215465 RepID=A0A9Q9EJV0_9PEZI|nr:putative aldehyde dehydrogenase domain, aldehyde/histidinol dehydrogenase [Septoria linicola]USW54151.1 Putative aldehyde dehydrogenase domain, aldehyde/histidinol dehydrogenase [Septoria linicola]
MAPNLPFKLNNPELFHDQALSAGSWVEAKSGKRFDVYDPGNGKVWATCPDCGPDDVDTAVTAAHEAFQEFKKVNPRIRAQCLLKWDQLIRENRDDLAQIVTYETGKPLFESQGELDYALGFTWWFAGEAERVQGTIQVPAAPNRRVFTVKQPIGVAVALVPWNFPIAMILRKAGAALAAGCTMIVKPSPETPFSVAALAHLAEKAGFPKGVFSVLQTSLESTPALSEALCRHALVKKVTFTGSTRVGKLVAKICSDGLKKCTLELGGNCPFLVFDDADLEAAATQLMALKWRHAGQACITANRVYVQKGVYDKFADILARKTKELVVGHGSDSKTTMGPVTTERSLDKASQQVEDAEKQGGKVILGGKKLHGTSGYDGYFFEPTIITGAKEGMQIAQEETFAPVMALFEFDTEEEAVRKANDTSMGLASYFFTKNVDRTWRLLENLEAGMIGMNTGNASAAESPFGGIKESGYGKESGKDVAVNEYMITKTGTLTLDGQY